MAAMKPRRPGTVEHAIMRAISDLGPECAAQAIGKSVSLLHRASNPDDEFCLSVELCIGLDAEYQVATGDLGPIQQAYAAQVAKRAGSLPYHEPGDPLDRLTEIVRETAEAVDAYRGSVGRSTPNSRMVALGEIGEAIEALQKAAQDIESMDVTIPFPKVAK